MLRVNRVGLLNRCLFVEHLSKTSIKTTYLSYEDIHSVEYENDNDAVIIEYKMTNNEDMNLTCKIPKECMVTTFDGNSHFCEKPPKERILNFYNELTMTYLTNYHDRDFD